MDKLYPDSDVTLMLLGLLLLDYKDVISMVNGMNWKETVLTSEDVANMFECEFKRRNPDSHGPKKPTTAFVSQASGGTGHIKRMTCTGIHQRNQEKKSNKKQEGLTKKENKKKCVYAWISCTAASVRNQDSWLWEKEQLS
ncbi:hypothetical protein RUND412_009638 [Rhizina undulata]